MVSSLLRSSSGRRARKLTHPHNDRPHTTTTKSRQTHARPIHCGPPVTNDTVRLPRHPADPSPERQLRLSQPKLPLPSSNPTTRHNITNKAAIPASPASTGHATVRSRTRPPVRVTIAQPNGNLLLTTNGVETALGIREGDVDSGMSTPRTDASDRLHVPSRGDEKRRLRSQDVGSRLRSELSIYFPNYDEIITDAPKEPEFLDVDSPIYISDESPKGVKAGPSSTRPTKPRTGADRASIAGSSSHNTSATFNGFQRVDFSSVNRLATRGHEDPLPDSLYFKPHRRAERKEKQLRNIEKERAMHEKVQLERLLEGLLGPDWLRVMGVSGITDSEKKIYEPKREYFIKEVRVLVEKFRLWKEEERRLKTERDEREKGLAAQEEENAGSFEELGHEEREDLPDSGAGIPRDFGSYGDPPAPSDIDARASRQLLQEASSASQYQASQSYAKSRPSKATAKGKAETQSKFPTQAHGPIQPGPISPAAVLPAEELNKPLASFFAKPYQRAAALGLHRHGRGAVMAFGQPIPEMEQKDFALPADFVTQEFMRSHARKRRRLKREAGTDRNEGD